MAPTALEHAKVWVAQELFWVGGRAEWGQGWDVPGRGWSQDAAVESVKPHPNLYPWTTWP